MLITLIGLMTVCLHSLTIGMECYERYGIPKKLVSIVNAVLKMMDLDQLTTDNKGVFLELLDKLTCEL